MRLVSHLKPNQDKTILVIDDIEINRHLLCRMLDDIGFHTVNTGSAKHALTMLKDNEVDLIFTDMMMPDMSGDEFLAVFRKFDQNTPVVAFSASSLQVNVDYYTAKGFDSYLSKPFRFEDVYQLIKELIHVEYQYRSELMEEEQAPDLASWKRLCLDNQDKIAALIAFCALYQITEIENLLDEWLSSVPESESFVNTLRSYVGKYDLEGLEAFLTGLKND